MFPERLRAYQVALASGDLVAEEQCRIALGSVLQYLLEDHLSRMPEWDADKVVDGVLPGLFEVTEEGRLAIRGLVVWYEGVSWYLDPFAAQVDLVADGAAVRSYCLRLGDADTGLRKFVYRWDAKERFRSPPDDWCFEFDYAAA